MTLDAAQMSCQARCSESVRSIVGCRGTEYRQAFARRPVTSRRLGWVREQLERGCSSPETPPERLHASGARNGKGAPMDFREPATAARPARAQTLSHWPEL